MKLINIKFIIDFFRPIIIETFLFQKIIEKIMKFGQFVIYPITLKTGKKKLENLDFFSVSRNEN